MSLRVVHLIVQNEGEEYWKRIEEECANWDSSVPIVRYIRPDGAIEEFDANGSPLRANTEFNSDEKAHSCEETVVTAEPQSRQPENESGPDDLTRVDVISLLQPAASFAVTRPCAENAVNSPKQNEPLTREETTMTDDKQINGNTECEEEDYAALAAIVGVDPEAAARLDEMSVDEAEEFVEEIQYRERTLNEIDRAKQDLVYLASQVRKLKLADEAPRCEHIKSNGEQCGSPAMKGTQLCYFHGETRKQRESEAAARTADLPVLEDMHSIQLAVMRVCGLLASKAIEEKTARVLFDGLRLAQKTLTEHEL